jgi:hypothetical protein
MEYRVMVNDAEQTEEPQVSRITTDRNLFDQWWAKAETFAVNRGLYACGQYRNGSDWQTLVEIES